MKAHFPITNDKKCSTAYMGDNSFLGQSDDTCGHQAAPSLGYPRNPGARCIIKGSQLETTSFPEGVKWIH